MTIEEFWKSYTVAENGCWIWNKRLSARGYGRVKMAGAGKTTHAHRVAFILTKGEIPNGMRACHKCDNPPCINPDHIFLGTAWDNTQDMLRKGRHWVHCGESHGMSKLTAESVKRARIAYATNHSLALVKQLANKFNVHVRVLQKAIKGDTWKHVE
jgi:hypothetical protein